MIIMMMIIIIIQIWAKLYRFIKITAKFALKFRVINVIRKSYGQPSNHLKFNREPSKWLFLKPSTVKGEAPLRPSLLQVFATDMSY